MQIKQPSTLLLAAILLALTACASPKPGTPEFVQKKEEDQQKAAVETVKQNIDQTPDWFNKEPADTNYIYGFATGVDGSRQMAYEKSLIAAKSQLAGKLGDYVTAAIKNTLESSGTEQDAQTTNAIAIIQKSLANDVKLVGWSEVNKKTVPQKDKYVTFIVLRYPLGEANKVLLSQIKKDQTLNSKLRASKALDDLEKEIEAAKKK